MRTLNEVRGTMDNGGAIGAAMTRKHVTKP